MEVTATNGTVSSPNFPNKYFGKKDCKWIVHSSPGQRIRVSLEVRLQVIFSLTVSSGSLIYSYFINLECQISISIKQVEINTWCIFSLDNPQSAVKTFCLFNCHERRRIM